MVGLRHGSPTRLQHLAAEQSADNRACCTYQKASRMVYGPAFTLAWALADPIMNDRERNCADCSR
jgi:hypothetical protein